MLSIHTLSEKRLKFLGIVIILLLTSLVYVNSLNNSFHFDDRHSIVENHNLRDIGNLPEFFTHPEMFSGQGHKMYRPLLLVTFALNYRFGGYDVFGYHVVNVLLHSFNAIFVFFIAFYLFSISDFRPLNSQPSTLNSLWPAFLAAIIFGLHTVNTQTVNYISSRSVLLVSFFYLGSFYFYIKAADRGFEREEKAFPPVSPGYYILALIFYLFGLLSKEIAVTLPLVIIFYDFLLGNRSKVKGERWKISDFKSSIINHQSSILKHLPFWLLTAGYLLIRKFLLGRAVIKISKEVLIGGIGGVKVEGSRSILINLLTQTKALAFYIKSLFFPTWLSVVHDTPETSGIADPTVLMSLVLLFLVLIIAVAARKRLVIITFCVLWFFVVQLPEIVMPLNLIVNEHRVYLPCVGFALMVGYIFHWSRLRMKDKRPLIFLTGCILLFISLNAYGTIKRNAVWSDDYTLWKDAVDKYPNNFISRSNLGFTYRKLGLLDNAVKEFRAASEIKSSDPVTHNNLAAVFLEKGLVDEAVKEFETALKLKPDYPEAYNGLGAAYYTKGLLNKAVEAYKMAIKYGPYYPKAHFNLGISFRELGKIAEAEAALKKALELEPGYYKAGSILGEIYFRQKRYDQAIDEYRKLLRLNAGNAAEVYANIGNVYMAKGDLERAYNEYSLALQADPSNWNARIGIKKIQQKSKSKF